MKYEKMSWIGKLFHTHYWKDPYNDEPTTCEDCGFIPRCPKHGCTLYTHGYYNLVDCLSCQKELRPKL